MSNLKKANINGTLYGLEPNDAITKSQLSAEVQASLTKADTALQEHQSLSAYRTAENQDLIDTELSRRILASFPTDTASGPIASFSDGADDMPMQSLVVNMEPIQEGSGDPSPDNVRPISGRTGCEVTRTGKNLLMNINPDTVETNGVTFTKNTDGSVTANGTVGSSSAAYYNLTNSTRFESAVFPCKQFIGKTLLYSISDVETPILARAAFWRENGSYFQPYSTFSTLQQFIVPDDAAYFRLFLQIPINTTVSNVTVYPMLRLLSDTDPTFEPYQGNTYSITFPTSAGTVYSGEIDYMAKKLTVTHKMITFDGSNFLFTTKGATQLVDEFYTAVTDGYLFDGTARYVTTEEGNAAGMICNIGPFIRYTEYAYSAYIGSGGTKLQLRYAFPLSAGIDTVEKANAYAQAQPIQCIYPLATPITYQLTPTEIRTLLGINNIWSDAGDVDVTYPADTKMYIDGKLAELQALILENIGG